MVSARGRDAEFTFATSRVATARAAGLSDRSPGRFTQAKAGDFCLEGRDTVGDCHLVGLAVFRTGLVL